MNIPCTTCGGAKWDRPCGVCGSPEHFPKPKREPGKFTPRPGPQKRFLVFEIEDYDTSGGMWDCKDSFETLEEAIKAATPNWGHIFDTVTHEIFER